MVQTDMRTGKMPSGTFSLRRLGFLKSVAGFGAPGRFQAVLATREGASVFKVVETNDFNQLPHVTLAFRPGHDADVKRFLAARLTEVRAAAAGLQGQLATTQVGTPLTLSQP